MANKGKKEKMANPEPVISEPEHTEIETKPTSSWEKFLDDLAEKFPWL